MKKIIFTFLVLFATLKVSAQISFLGFDQPFCPDPIVNVYTYSNYTCGTPGCPHGFKVYMNGLLVNDIYGSMGSAPTCLDMKFINDSTGFVVVVFGLGTSVLKTSNYGITWTSIGSVPPVGYSGSYPNYWGMYILNANYVYLVAGFPTMSVPEIFVCRASDIDPPTSITNHFISDDTINADIYKTDTVYGNTLCNIDSLNIFVKSGTDTIDYHINFFSLPLGINEISNNQTHFSVYPNPAQNQINIVGDSFSKAEIYTIQGQNIVSSSSAIIDVEFLASGVYFLRIIDSSGNVSNSKFIKQ